MFRLAESLERDNLFAAAVPRIPARSDFLIRNRYLSRIGASVSQHLNQFNIVSVPSSCSSAQPILSLRANINNYTSMCAGI
jgi:hypothetical protein